MHRRHALGLAALVAVSATPALAQLAPKTEPGDKKAAKAEKKATRAMMGGPIEQRYMQQTMAAGSAALATSREALDKVQNARVKMFAELEIAEQETIADVLKGGAARDVKPTSQAEVEAQLDDAGRAELQKVRSAQRGGSFDRDFIQIQIDGHQKLLQIQESYIGEGRDPRFMAIAKLARGMIKEHLRLLEVMRSEVT